MPGSVAGRETPGRLGEPVGSSIFEAPPPPSEPPSSDPAFATAKARAKAAMATAAAMARRGALGAASRTSFSASSNRD